MTRIFALLSLIFCYSATQATISQIRWGSTGDPLNGLTITWSSTGTADSIQWGYTSSYEMGTFGSIKRSGYTTPSFFAFQFPSVTPNAQINYRLKDSGTGTWTARKTYNTAPDPNLNTYTFAVLGDCRSSASMWTTISNLASARQPDFCLFNGDLTNSGTLTSEYNTWFSAGANFLENNLCYHAEGNHETTNTSLFSNLFDLPVTNGTNLYYAVRYANTLFITINSCTPTNTAMLTWLHNTLLSASSDPTIVWKVASFHHPFFNIGNHAGDMDPYRGTIWKEFDDFGVDIVFNGHDHNYQRSKPVNLNVSTTAPMAQYGSGPNDGRLEIITGGAGASLYAQGSTQDAWAMYLFNQTYNYTTVDVQNCKIKIIAYDNNNTIIDSLSLNKTGIGACNTTGTVYNPIFTPISIVPNPVEGKFELKYSSVYTGEATVKIFDPLGKEISSEKINKTGEALEYHHDMSRFPKGIYTVSLIMGTQRENAVLILSK